MMVNIPSPTSVLAITEVGEEMKIQQQSSQDRLLHQIPNEVVSTHQLLHGI